MMQLRVQMLTPASARCNWKRRMSSSVAVSGARLRNAANRLQLRMWPLCVPALSLAVGDSNRQIVWISDNFTATVLLCDDHAGQRQPGAGSALGARSLIIANAFVRRRVGST